MSKQLLAYENQPTLTGIIRKLSFERTKKENFIIHLN